MTDINPATRLPVLRRVPILQGLRTATLLEVARRCVEMTYPAGATLVRQGDPGDRLCIIAGGSAEVHRDGEVVARLQAGDYYGEISLIDGRQRAATVVATEDVVQLELGVSDFESLLAIPFVARAIMVNLARMVRETGDPR